MGDVKNLGDARNKKATEDKLDIRKMLKLLFQNGTRVDYVNGAPICRFKIRNETDLGTAPLFSNEARLLIRKFIQEASPGETALPSASLLDETLQHLAAAAGKYKTSGVDVGTEGAEEAIRACIIALESAPNVYQFCGELYYMRQSEGERTTLMPISVEWLQWELKARSVYRVSDRGRVDVIPTSLAKRVLSNGSFGAIRKIVGVVETPVLRSDRSVLQVEGYDAESKLFYAPAATFEWIEENPTKEHVASAVAFLDDVLGGFTLTLPTFKAAALSAGCVLLSRYGLGGSVPGHYFNAPRRGSGKSLLAKVMGFAGTGRSPGSTSLKNTEELEKFVSAVEQSGSSLLFFDNVKGSVDSSELESLVTSDERMGRRLGSSTMYRVRNYLTLFLTANNSTLSEDMTRRVVSVRIVPEVECPEERTGWKYELQDANTLAALAPRITCALLTILRGYAVSGERVTVPAWGSFEAYSAVIREALVWANVGDPYGGTAGMELFHTEEGETLPSVIDVLHQIAPVYPRSAGDLAKAIQLGSIEGKEAYIAAHKMLVEQCADFSGEKVGPRKFQALLKKHADGVFGGVRVQPIMNHHRKVLEFSFPKAV